ncbi:MAG TPA: metallopeptidase TldD-related protein [Candidatus Acidoferrales bacterium]|jgi:predicted Zn-dependent protease|nr:metallopeptidase TldD-related protein [Candidatus Acidoferrales bacterium]
MRAIRLFTALLALAAAFTAFAQAPADNDHTLQAMKDEMARAKSRLELQIPKLDKPVRPYHIEYRLLDMDIREVVAEYGALVTSRHDRSRVMNVSARIGDYKLDSSNFVTEDGFRGFIGPSGTVGIDRDYDSLRQDLWIATDQAFKEAVETYSRKQAYLSSLARQSDIDDFSRVQPVQHIEPLVASDWTNRNWDQEARDSSAALRAFPQIYESKVTYYLVFTTEYLLTSEGTEVRANHSFAAIESGLSSLADDGMQVSNYYATYAPRPADLPSADAVRKALNVAGTELMAMRAAPPAPDYTGPVLFEPRAAAALLAEVLTPSLSGARPPLAFQPVVEQLMSSLGGRSDWSGKVGTRVLPAGVTLMDNPAATDYKGALLVGGYAIDQEGVPGEKVTVVDEGKLKNLLMSRRPGPDFEKSNGHGRSAFLVDAKPVMSNLFFSSTESLSKEDLKKKFLDSCRAEKLEYCIVVRQMDNPSLSLLHQEDFSELLASFGGNAATDRLPLVVYKIYAADGREEIVRGARISGFSPRMLRNIEGIGNDNVVFNYMQNQTAGVAGTALAAFGTAQNGLPASVVAPSLLFEEVEVRGARGEPKHLPLLPEPPMSAKGSL